MIEAHNVHKAFGEVRALAGVSLHIRPGEVFGCLGHNGAGKTTLVRVLNGVLRRDTGAVQVLGLDPVAAREVRELIRTLAADGRRAVFLCTHDLGEAQRLCHRLAILEHGRVLVTDSPAAQDAAAAAAGTSLRVVCRMRDEIPALVRALTEAGIDLYTVSPVRPTLEEVYLALHRRGAAARTGEGREQR